jgi:hypothetical protein
MAADTPMERLHAGGDDGAHLLISMMSTTRDCVLAQDVEHGRESSCHPHRADKSALACALAQSLRV